MIRNINKTMLDRIAIYPFANLWQFLRLIYYRYIIWLPDIISTYQILRTYYDFLEATIFSNSVSPLGGISSCKTHNDKTIGRKYM